MGRQPPQPVPAVVQSLTASTVPRQPSRIADTMADFVKLLQKQTCASSPRTSPAPALLSEPMPAICAGSAGRSPADRARAASEE